MIAKARSTAISMQSQYRFYFPPVFDDLDSLQSKYIERMQEITTEAGKDKDHINPDGARELFISEF